MPGQATEKGDNAWWPTSQQTPSKLLLDRSIITAFGTGYRIRKGQPPRDAGMVRWQPNTGPVNTDTTIRNPPVDSGLRNVFDLAV